MIHIKSLAKISLIAALAACSACQGKEAPAVPAGEQAASETNAVVKTEKISAGKTAADPAYVKKDTYFKVPAVAGGEIDLASYAGKPVMFMLFTETCPYCRRAAPALENIYRNYGAKGLTVLGLCTQDNPQAPKNFAAELGITFPLAYGARQVYQQYRAQGVPYIFLLNKAHEVVTVWPGYDKSFDKEMAQKVEAELAKK
ncbi:MAG TPA: TlpA disulfide reductase family protein [Elusimicrobiales bacterium]|nr:TlpA disulfide reductase family protein [Elusimicrobiales bacterium]